MEKDIKEIIITKEKAVFWMDAQGRWCNCHGPFEHPKIIAFFNRSICRDRLGYFVEQVCDGVHEKVYFRYGDTPLFVIDTIADEPSLLLMNTGERIRLSPDELFVCADQLYLRRGDEIIKFTERVLLRLAAIIRGGDRGYAIFFNGAWRTIEVRDEAAL